MLAICSALPAAVLHLPPQPSDRWPRLLLFLSLYEIMCAQSNNVPIEARVSMEAQRTLVKQERDITQTFGVIDVQQADAFSLEDKANILRSAERFVPEEEAAQVHYLTGYAAINVKITEVLKSSLAAYWQKVSRASDEASQHLSHSNTRWVCRDVVQYYPDSGSMLMVFSLGLLVLSAMDLAYLAPRLSGPNSHVTMLPALALFGVGVILLTVGVIVENAASSSVSLDSRKGWAKRFLYQHHGTTVFTSGAVVLFVIPCVFVFGLCCISLAVGSGSLEVTDRRDDYLALMSGAAGTMTLTIMITGVIGRRKENFFAYWRFRETLAETLSGIEPSQAVHEWHAI